MDNFNKSNNLDDAEYIKDIDILGITNMDSNSFEESLEKTPEQTSLVEDFLKSL